MCREKSKQEVLFILRAEFERIDKNLLDEYHREKTTAIKRKYHIMYDSILDTAPED